MSLQERLTAELRASMMAKNADRTATLRLVKSALGYVQIEKKTDALADAEVIGVLQREAKKRRDSIGEFERGGRAELAAQERVELAVIEEFLPQPLTAEELESLVKQVIAEVGATSKKDLGIVMKAAQVKVAGRADGKTLSGLVGRLLP